MSEERRRQSDKALDEFGKILKDTAKTVNEIHTNQAVIKEKVERIEKETIKTNGRVTKVEAWQNTKNGEFKIIYWAVGVVFASVVAAWVKIVIK